MNKYRKELKELGLNKNQILAVQRMMAQYALEAIMDRSVREEAEFLCQDDINPDEHYGQIEGNRFKSDPSEEPPQKPYKYEKVIDDNHAYLVDANGIIWTLHRLDSNLSEKILLRDCLRLSLWYVRNYDPQFKNKLPSLVLEQIGVSDPISPHYDQEYFDGKF